MKNKSTIVATVNKVFLNIMSKKEIKSPLEIIDDVISGISSSVYGVIQNSSAIKAALVEEAIKIIEEGTLGKVATLLQIAHRYSDVIYIITSQYKQDQVNLEHINLKMWDTPIDSHRYHLPININEVWHQGSKYSRITHKDYKNDIYTAYEADFIDGFYTDKSLKSRQSSTYSIDEAEVFFKQLNAEADNIDGKLWVDTLIPSFPPSRGISTSKCGGWGVDGKPVFSSNSSSTTCSSDKKKKKAVWDIIKDFIKING